MKKIENTYFKFIILIVCVFFFTPSKIFADLEADFISPPAKYKSHPFYNWGSLDKGQIDAFLDKAKNNYGGMTLERSAEYMTPAFLDTYKHYLDKLASVGMTAVLYDENGFPSGQAGGSVPAQFRIKQLNMLAEDVTGPNSYTKQIPSGFLMACVVMNNATKVRTDITSSVSGGKLQYTISSGSHKVMIFTCGPAGTEKMADYLDSVSSHEAIKRTFQKVYDVAPEHFGTTIQMTFFDDVSFSQADNGRMWTPSFNAKFEAKYGYSPAVYYPALWMDIGSETEFARNAMFGIRAEQYSHGFPKAESDWARAHGIKGTGHFNQGPEDNRYLHNQGDYMLAAKYVDYPGLDETHFPRRSAKKYKIMSSVAYNWDKPVVMTEVFAAFRVSVDDYLYKEAMELFSKGINFLVPAGANRFSQVGIDWNNFVGRSGRMLQGGRHVADIGVLYPIAGIFGGLYFDKFPSTDGPNNHANSEWRPPEIDIADVNEALSTGVRRDFTLIHPEVLDQKCDINADKKLIHLSNTINWEEYKVFILPGMKTIHWSNLQKIKAFWDAGGKIISTTQLPFKSVEKGKDAEVQSTIQAIFNLNPAQPNSYKKNANEAGGEAFFLPSPSASELKKALDDANEVYDVEFETDLDTTGGPITYIHKVLEGRDILYFSNASNKSVDTFVKIRGKLKNPKLWDPHSGDKSTIPEFTNTTEAGEEITRLRLKLPTNKSVFLVSDANPLTIKFVPPQQDKNGLEVRIYALSGKRITTLDTKSNPVQWMNNHLKPGVYLIARYNNSAWNYNKIKVW